MGRSDNPFIKKILLFAIKVEKKVKMPERVYSMEFPPELDDYEDKHEKLGEGIYTVYMFLLGFVFENKHTN